MPEPTGGEVLLQIQEYFEAFNADRALYRNWVAGPPTGGPNGDGRYPLTDWSGSTYLTPSPAKALQDIGGGTSGAGRVWLMSMQSGLPPSPTTEDCTTAINNAMTRLNLAGGGVLEFDMAVYVNGKLRQPSNVTMRFLGETYPLIYGSMGSHEMSGELGEDPQSRNIRQTSSSGTRVLYLSNSAQSNHTNYAVGDRIILRGQNDAFGASLFKDNAAIESIDALLNTLTLKEELDNTYTPTYPGSAWPNDTTTIRKQLQALLVIDSAVGGNTITVNNPSMFTVGAHVLISDDMLGTEVAGVVSNNLVNMEANEVVGIVGPVITLAFPIMHPYKMAFNASMQVVIPVVNAKVKNATVRWAANSDKTSRYAFSILCGRDCDIEDCKALGDPANNLGPIGHCFRMGLASLRCTVARSVVWRPAAYASGQGYGATIYKGARFCKVIDSHFEGCRHSVLLFSGACQNFIARNHSTDCRGTDYDLHGARETANWFHQNKAVGGQSPKAFNQRAAFKIGNTTHTAGSFFNVFTENVIEDYDGHAFHGIPSSDWAMIARNTIRRITGEPLQLDRNANASRIKIKNFFFIENVIDGCAGLFGTSGSVGADNLPLADDTYSGVIIAGNRLSGITGTADLIEAYRVTGLVIDDNSARFAAGTPTTGKFAVRLENCPAPELSNFRQRGGASGVKLVNSPNAKFAGFDARGLADRILLNADAASVAGLSFTDYVAAGFDAAFVLGGAGAEIAARSNTFAVARDALSRPTTIAGAANSVAFSSAEPAATTGIELCRVSMKARTPRSHIAFQANLPSVVFSASDNAVALVYWSQDGGATWALGGAMTWRGTAGASSDTGAAISGAFQHTLADLATPLLVQLRLCQKTNTTDLTLADRFGADNRAVLTCREAA